MEKMLTLTTYLENAPESTKYIDRIELRTKTEDFELEKQKYSMRSTLKVGAKLNIQHWLTTLLNLQEKQESAGLIKELPEKIPSVRGIGLMLQETTVEL